jgi:hypothetical protein
LKYECCFLGDGVTCCCFLKKNLNFFMNNDEGDVEEDEDVDGRRRRKQKNFLTKIVNYPPITATSPFKRQKWTAGRN